MYDKLLKQWDNAYLAIHRDDGDVEKHVTDFNKAVQSALDDGAITKDDAVHFAALMCYLGKGYEL